MHSKVKTFLLAIFALAALFIGLSLLNSLVIYYCWNFLADSLQLKHIKLNDAVVVYILFRVLVPLQTKNNNLNYLNKSL